jgi:hypothetical protein
MHRQVNALVSAGGSPGKLALFGIALGEAGVDIGTIGGAEWRHDGPLSVILKDDSTEQIDAFARVCHDHHVPWLIFRTVGVELNDVPGALGAAADAVGDINIYSVNVLRPHGNKAVVGLGIRPSLVDDAVARLETAGFTAARRPHPDEPGGSPWWDRWDDRTEELLPLWEDESVANDDPRFWQVGTTQA